MSWESDELYYRDKIPNFYLLKNAKLSNKRIQREIISIQKCIDNNSKNEKGSSFVNIDPICVEFVINNANKITFNILFKYKYTISFQLEFNKEYPFRPPTCEILTGDQKDYQSLLGSISKHYYKKEMQDSKKKKCLCCDTLLCRSNWHPGTNITGLLEEINTNTTYIYDIVYTMLKKKIYDKHLGYQIIDYNNK